MVVKWAYDRMGFTSRGVASRFVIAGIIGTTVGSLAPEIGSVLAYNMGIFPHIFNPFFLAVGIIGIGVALFSRHRNGK